MNCLIGLDFENFSLLAADKIEAAHGIILIRHDDNKVFRLLDRMVLAVIGEAGDTVQFAEYIAKNIKLQKIRNGYEMTCAQAAHFTRSTLAQHLRTRSPYNCHMLLVGWDGPGDGSEPHVYFIDQLASMKSMPLAAVGIGGLFATAAIDRHYKHNSTLEEGIDLLRLCVADVQKRLNVNLPNFQVIKLDKDGTQQLEDITVHSLHREVVAN